MSFGISSASALFRTGGLDAVYLNTWPIVAMGLVALVARLKRVPYVVSVQDVYPEALLVQNRTGARIIAPLLRWIDARVAKSAAAVIVLSEAFASIYRDDRGVDPARIHIIPNWISDVGQAPRAEALAYRRAREIADDEFLVVYGGNVGVAAGVEQLVEAFRHVGDRKIRLLIAGGGSRVESCQTLAQIIAPDRIQFHRPWHEDETYRVLAAADLLALPTAGAGSRVSVPSKLISYLLAERPVLASVEGDSEIARIVRQSGAGWTIEPGDAHRLAEGIIAASRASETERTGMGTRGRRYAESHFGRERCVARVRSIITSAIRPL